MGLHNLSHKSCGRGLAIGSGNCNQLALSHMIGQLNLAPDRDLCLIQYWNKGRIQRNSRADYRKLHSQQICPCQFSQHNSQTLPVLFLKLFLQFFCIQFIISVIQDHIAAHLQHQPCCSDTAFSGTCY